MRGSSCKPMDCFYFSGCNSQNSHLVQSELDRIDCSAWLPLARTAVSLRHSCVWPTHLYQTNTAGREMKSQHVGGWELRKINYYQMLHYRLVSHTHTHTHTHTERSLSNIINTSHKLACKQTDTNANRQIHADKDSLDTHLLLTGPPTHTHPPTMLLSWGSDPYSLHSAPTQLGLLTTHIY